MESDNEFEKKKGMFHVKHFCSVRETLLNECIKTVLSGGTECPLDRVVVLRRRRWMLLMWFAVGGEFVCGIFSCAGWWKWNWENVSCETLEEGVRRENDGMNPVYQRVSVDDLEGVGELLGKGMKRDEWKKCDWNVSAELFSYKNNPKRLDICVGNGTFVQLHLDKNQFSWNCKKKCEAMRKTGTFFVDFIGGDRRIISFECLQEW